jgi:hypothetical protein
MREQTQRRRLVVFLDYDGTLTPCAPLQGRRGAGRGRASPTAA